MTPTQTPSVAPSATTPPVTTPPLAETGTNDALIWLGVASTALLAAGGAILAIRRRARTAA